MLQHIRGWSLACALRMAYSVNHKCTEVVVFILFTITSTILDSNLGVYGTASFF